MSRIGLLVLMLLWGTQKGNAQSIDAPRLHVLDNGMRVITVEDHNNPIVTTVWSAQVGDSIESPEFAGNSHFLEHLLLFRGTEKYPGNAIGEWVDSRGGYFNGHTWADWTTFEITSAAADIGEALSRHEQMMFHATFSGTDFETEKNAVFEELRAGQDNPYVYMLRSMGYDLYSNDTFYSRDTIGSIDTVQKATVERVREHYQQYYVPNNIALAVVGAIDTDEVVEAIRQRFGGYPDQALPELPYRPISIKPGIEVTVEERSVGKAYLLLAFEGPQATGPEFFPYLLLAEYLAGGNSSLLVGDLVQRRQLFDTVAMSDWPRRHPKGWQCIYADTKPEKVVDGLAAMWESLRIVQHESIDESALELARKRLIRKHRQAKDDQYQYAMSLAAMDSHGDYRIFAEFETRLAQVEASDVQAVARKLLDDGNHHVKVLFPPGSTPDNFNHRVVTMHDANGSGQGGARSRTAAGGVQVIVEPVANAAMESITVAVRAGTSAGQVPGLAAATAGMLSRGTEGYSRKEIRAYLDANGISFSDWSDVDAAYFSFQFPPEGIVQALTLVSEMLTRPRFNDDDWAQLRDEKLAEMATLKDQPRAMAMDQLMSTAFGDSGYGRTIEQVERSIGELNARQLRAFWRENYHPANIMVSYMGGSSSETIDQYLQPISAIAVSEAPRSAPTAPEIESSAHQTLHMEGKAQTNIVMAWAAPEITSDEWVLWELARQAIGGDLASRLWPLRQEQGLAYTITMQSLETAAQPLTYVFMATAAEQREAALEALRTTMVEASQGLREDELERVKLSYVASMSRYDRTAARRTNRQAGWWVRGHDARRRQEIGSIIESADLASVNAVIAQVLDPERYVLVETGAVPK